MRQSQKIFISLQKPIICCQKWQGRNEPKNANVADRLINRSEEGDCEVVVEEDHFSVRTFAFHLPPKDARSSVFSLSWVGAEKDENQIMDGGDVGWLLTDLSALLFISKNNAFCTFSESYYKKEKKHF